MKRKMLKVFEFFKHNTYYNINTEFFIIKIKVIIIKIYILFN